MKVLIISDTHRHLQTLGMTLYREKGIDMLIHCGDIEGDEEQIREMVDCPCLMVSGNNDFFSQLNREEIFDLGKYRVWLTHGHNYGVTIGYERIASEGKAFGMQIIMCGHTHKPVVYEYQGVTIINPGSLSYPRQEGKEPSYIIANVDDDGEVHFEIKYI
ncbi:MAG: metallophosphoesterase family protein [Eubacterium sp.]